MQRTSCLLRPPLVNVKIVPMLKDNYSYVLRCGVTGAMAAVDVSEAPKAVAALTLEKKEHQAGAVLSSNSPSSSTSSSSSATLPSASSSSVTATANTPLSSSDFSVMTTHKHWDHAGGNKALVKQFHGLIIRGGELDNAAHVTHPMKDGDSFSVGDVRVDVHHTPCHTSGHVLFHCYHPDEREAGVVFTGDTVFVGGVGAFFEGNAATMVTSLRKFADLPPATRMYPGHEYTMNFIDYANTLGEDAAANPTLDRLTKFFREERAGDRPAIPSTVGDELAINPFVRAAVGGSTAVHLATHFKIPPTTNGSVDSVALMQAVYNNCP